MDERQFKTAANAVRELADATDSGVDTILEVLSGNILSEEDCGKVRRACETHPEAVANQCCESGVRSLRGAKRDGDQWTCPCGKSWVYVEDVCVEDEAEGGFWHRSCEPNPKAP